MELLTEQREQMLANGRQCRPRRRSFKPVVRLSARGATRWLLTELDPDDPDIAFGLCDPASAFPSLAASPSRWKLEGPRLTHLRDESSRHDAFHLRAVRPQASRESEAAMRRDIYQDITDQIVANSKTACARGSGHGARATWKAASRFRCRHNGIAYRGVNILTLWMAALAKGYSAPIWMTFKQAIDLGGGVRKGEKGSLTVYADNITRTETDAATGEEAETAIPFMKGYTVFNVEQIDGLPAHYYPQPEPVLETVAAHRARRSVLRRDRRRRSAHGGNRAYYARGSDHIQMPPFEAFRDAESYYATLAHEMHALDAATATRLDRNFGEALRR